MQRRTPDFARIFAGASLEAAEIDAVIELAFLMAHANGDASPDELEALRSLIKHLQPTANVGVLFEKYSVMLEGEGAIPERVRISAKSLSRDTARDLAYKAVYAIAVYDLETNEAERDLEELVIGALGLDDKRAHELGLQTTHALLANP
jgi:tellurite resistance protein